MLVHTALTMGRRGLLNPGRPDRVLRQLWALMSWGYGLPGELRSAANRDPDRIAVIDDERSLTYRELLDSVSTRAIALQAHGPRSGRVGLLRRNNADFVIDVIACAMAGLDVVLMNTQHSPAQLAEVRRVQQIATWLCDPEFAGLVGAAPMPRAAAGSPRQPAQEGRSIVLTSGTTGAPKGARRPAATGIAPLISILSRIPIRVGGRTLISAPMFHTWGYAGLQVSLAMRSTIVLRGRFDAADALDTLVREKCDTLFAVPLMLSRLLDERPRPTRLRVVAVSGSALPSGLATAFMDAYGDVLYNLYGSTEASWVSIATPANLRLDPSTAGRPPRGTVVKIIDGAIYVGNGMLFDGYTNGASGDRRDGLLATGDRGHWGEGGMLFVDGRTDDMIISGGENIYPATIERAILSLSEVADVAVFGVADPEFGQRPAAWIVLHDGARLSEETVRSAVRKLAAPFCVPRDVHFIDELPRNSAGKVVRRLLPHL